MEKIGLALLMFLMMALPAQAADVTLAWDASANADGYMIIWKHGMNLKMLAMFSLIL